jgi:hypothetical protein
MYVLEELKDEGQRFSGIRISANGRTVVELKGGISIVIATEYAAQNTRPDYVKDAFLSGIVLAMSHCAITGQVPIAMVG